MLIIGTKSSFDEDKIFASERLSPGVYRAAENRGGRKGFPQTHIVRYVDRANNYIASFSAYQDIGSTASVRLA
jgi:hypothetical protein